MVKIELINDDCSNAMKNINSGSVDLILTDPPYNLGVFMKNRDTNLLIDYYFFHLYGFCTLKI